MELRVLGCSGGIGESRQTTSFMVDGEVLIDAGSGVGRLSLDEMAGVKHIFLTHSHLDHVHAIPLLVDSIFDRIDEPIIVHGLPETIQALQSHIFNWVIWPDFTRLPHPDSPVLAFEPMQPGERYRIGDNTFEMIPVHHIVPTVGYLVTSPTATFAFSGDTTTNDTLWDHLNSQPRLDMLVVEAAFSNKEEELCHLSRHYCPKLLAADLLKLKHNPTICLTHAKPGEEEHIYQECRESIVGRQLVHLSGGERFTL